MTSITITESHCAETDLHLPWQCKQRISLRTKSETEKRENDKMIMKCLRLHPERGHSMHYIRLVRGGGTKKHCTFHFIQKENIVG